MVVLKKIKGATLVEVLTASVLIVIVFMIASLSFNNIFGNQIRNDHSTIHNKIKEIEYLLWHNQISMPYSDDFGNWELNIFKENGVLMLSAENGTKTIEKEVFISEK